MRNGFFKGHGLGNDYIVLDPAELDFELTPVAVRALCDRNRGIGGDGVLAPVPSEQADIGLRIFNPDGSEAEKSGNGIRIFASYLCATRRTRRREFRVETRGGIVGVEVQRNDQGAVSRATVVMGHASFRPQRLPCTLDVPELIGQPLRVAGRSVHFTGVSIGNPHCVVFKAASGEWTRDDLLALGPAIEHHELFPERTNVQLAVPTGPRSVSILVWERGVGETRASGTSACAVAAAAVRHELVRSPVSVRAPGGVLSVTVDEHFDLTLEGDVSEVARGRLSAEFVRALL
ncbi:MAG: diaminopimelate epimerase [Myxococcota bacterium]